MSFADDRNFELRFIQTIKNIVGPYLLMPSSIDVDMKEATDLLILHARDKRIGCRVRRYGFAERYPWDFTIRSKRNSGAKTELEKIIEGWGDWMFYGHEARPNSSAITRWFLIDLNVWRAHMICTAEIGLDIPNGDGTYFRAYDVRKLPSSICVAQSPFNGEVNEASLDAALRLRLSVRHS